MLESLELNNREPCGRELYVRHQQVYALLELNVRLSQLKCRGERVSEFDDAIRVISVLISELVTRFEEAATPGHKAPDYSDTQITNVRQATSILKDLCDRDVQVASLVQAARMVVAAGSQPRFARPQLVVSNS